MLSPFFGPGLIHMAGHNKTIAFRLHDSLIARLAAQAEERQMSVGEYTRLIVIEQLSSSGSAELKDAAAENLKVLKDLGIQLRKATFTLLCNAGNAEPKEAFEWVEANLGSLPKVEQKANGHPKSDNT